MDRSLRDSLALVEDSHWWFVGRRRILRALLERHEVEGPLLEVGCGTGANLPMLAEFGSVVGVEPDSLDLSRAQERGIGRLVQGALPQQLHVDDQFGTVLALDVIEHVDDHEEAVSTLVSRIQPGGHLVLTVPAYPWLWSAHDRINGHYRRYTRRSLLGLLDGHPVDVRQISYFNAWMLPAVTVVRTLGRLIGRDGAGTEPPPRPLNSVLTNVLASEALLLKRLSLPAGVSLVAVARRI